jgi:hypothetical protein
MTAPQFTHEQKISLAKLGLVRRQITKLELTLPLAKAWMDAEVSPMRDTHDVLTESRTVMHAAMYATMKLLHPSSMAQREASYRVIDADCDADQEGGAVMDAFRALVEASCVLDKALDALPKEQRRAQTSIMLFQRIDKALLDGFIEDSQQRRADKELVDRVVEKGLPAYPRIEPLNGGVYKKIIRIYYDAMGLPNGNPDQAIRNYIAWLKELEKHRDLRRKEIVGSGGENDWPAPTKHEFSRPNN